MFEPKRQELSDFFKAVGDVYDIPPNQRNFAWKAQQAADLYDDLWASVTPSGGEATPRPRLFLGQIILAAGGDEDTWEVIDGQQRLTTLSLLLACLRRRADELGKDRVRDKIHEEICVVPGDDDVIVRTRIKVSPSIAEMYQRILADMKWNGSWPESPSGSQKKEIARLKPIIEVFWNGLLDEEGKLVSEYPPIKSLTEDQLAELRRATQKAYWIRIALSQKQEAFQIFERTNARGLDLDVSDLLKNYLFQYEVPSIHKKWDAIAKNADSHLVPMLRQFYFTSKGYVSKAELYPRLKDYGRKHTPSDLTEAIFSYSTFFAVASTADAGAFVDWLTRRLPAIRHFGTRLQNSERSLRSLRAFKQVQFYPAFYALLELAIQDDTVPTAEKAARIESVLRALECFHFTNNVVCRRPANETERLYAGLGPKARDGIPFATACDTVIQELRHARAPQAEFDGKFTALKYSDSVAVRYYFHRAVYRDFAKNPPSWIHEEQEPDASHRVFSARRDEQRSLWELHHLMPQSEESSHPWVHSIGNLLPMPKKNNADLGNLPPAEQIAHPAIQSLITSQHYHRRWEKAFGDSMKDGWNEEVVAERARVMAAEAYGEIWVF